MVSLGNCFYKVDGQAFHFKKPMGVLPANMQNRKMYGFKMPFHISKLSAVRLIVPVRCQREAVAALLLLSQLNSTE